jgi:heparinase II/III-like protein
MTVATDGPRRRLFTEARLEVARHDRQYPRNRILRKLRRACEGHLNASVSTIHQLKHSRNLFVWNAVISELALMHVLSDDERYLDHVLDFLALLYGEGWCDVEMDEHLHAPYVLTALAVGDELLRGRLPDNDVDRLRLTMHSTAQSVWDGVHGTRWGERERTVWNHNIITFATLGIAGLLLPEHPLAGEWLDVGIERTRHFLEVGVSPAGMTWEGHHYCGYVFRQLGIFLEALDAQGRIGQVVPAGSELEQKLRRVPVWYAHDCFPRGAWLQNYNDSHWDPHSSLFGFLTAFARYEPELCAAVWDHLVGKRGQRTYGRNKRFSSLAESMLFFPQTRVRDLRTFALDNHFFCPDVGYLVARDGWDEDASVVTFNAGPLNGRIHDQSDNNSFTLIARGAPIVLDSGAANDPGDDSASSASGHNSVFIDGVGMHPAGAGTGVSGRITAVESHATWAAAVGDATDSYNEGAYNPVRHAFRHVLFVTDPEPYVVTYDDIDKDGEEHDYEYLLHVPGGEPELGQAAGGKISVDGSPAGIVRVLHPTPSTLECKPFRTQRRPFGPHNEHELWRFSSRAVNPHFLVLFAAAAATEPLEIETEVRPESAEITVRLGWEHGTDEIAFTPVRHGTPASEPTPPELRRL